MSRTFAAAAFSAAFAFLLLVFLFETDPSLFKNCFISASASLKGSKFSSAPDATFAVYCFIAATALPTEAVLILTVFFFFAIIRTPVNNQTLYTVNDLHIVSASLYIEMINTSSVKDPSSHLQELHCLQGT